MDGVQGAILSKAALGSRCSKCRTLVKGHPYSHRQQCSLASKGIVMVNLPPCLRDDLHSVAHLNKQELPKFLTQGLRLQTGMGALWWRTHHPKTGEDTAGRDDGSSAPEAGGKHENSDVVTTPWCCPPRLQKRLCWPLLPNKYMGKAVNGQRTRPKCQSSLGKS